jgi:hypothetical protein
MAAPLQFLTTTFPLTSAGNAVLYKPRVNELTAQLCIEVGKIERQKLDNNSE